METRTSLFALIDVFFMKPSSPLRIAVALAKYRAERPVKITASVASYIVRNRYPHYPGTEISCCLMWLRDHNVIDAYSVYTK